MTVTKAKNLDRKNYYKIKNIARLYLPKRSKNRKIKENVILYRPDFTIKITGVQKII